MNGQTQLPEVMFKILNKLDNEALFNASKVSVEWKKNVHGFLFYTMKKDPELKDKFEKFGWIMTDHDVQNCQCIEKNLCLFKLVENPPKSLTKVYDPYYDNMYESHWRIRSSAVSKSKLFIYEHWDCYMCKCNWSTSHIKMIDLSKDRPGRSEELDHRHAMDLKHVSLSAFDNTLVAVYCFDSTSCESDGVSTNQKVKLWNTKSGDYGYELNVLDHVEVDKSSKLNKDRPHTFGIVEIDLDLDRLVLHVEIHFKSQLHDVQTIIWRLNTNKPSTDDTCFVTRIRHSSDQLSKKALINAQFICRFSSTDDSKMIEVTNFDYPQNSKTTSSVDINAAEFLDHGKSSKLYVWNLNTESIKLYDISSGGLDCVFNFDLRTLTDRGGFHFLNFIVHHGKLILVRKFCEGQELQFFILTEDGVMIDGARVKMTSDISLERRDPFFVNEHGVVAVTKDDAWKF